MISSTAYFSTIFHGACLSSLKIFRSIGEREHAVPELVFFEFIPWGSGMSANQVLPIRDPECGFRFSSGISFGITNSGPTLIGG